MTISRVQLIVALLATATLAACPMEGGEDGGACDDLLCEDVPPGCFRVQPDDGSCSCGVLTCGDAGVDAGNPSTDDAGFVTDVDAGRADAGNATTDAGNAPADAGNAPTDAGNAPADAGNAPADAGNAPGDAGVAGDAGPAPWSDGVTIDGTNDFLTDTERFTTTTTAFFVYATWDATALYVGYEGADVDDDSADKWVQIYVDTDPGASTGAPEGPVYNTQKVDFPAGYGAEVHIQRDTRATGAYLGERHVTGSTWDTALASTTVTAAAGGTFMEFRIPWAVLGGADEVGVIVLMMNETSTFEFTFGGLYEGSFTDGYYDASTTAVPVTKYLHVDRASAAAPNDVANLVDP